MEVPSSTDWNINTSVGCFRPNAFMEVSQEDIRKKFDAISVYKDVIRNAPDPRSSNVLTSMAICRGSQAGAEYAEAFQQAFRLGV